MGFNSGFKMLIASYRLKSERGFVFVAYDGVRYLADVSAMRALCFNKQWRVSLAAISLLVAKRS